MSEGLPAGWSIATLGECTEILDRYRVPVNSAERSTRTGMVPYYGATGQVGWIDDHLFDEDLVLLGEDGAPFLDPLKPKAYMIHGRSWVNNHAHVLRGKGGVSNRFLMYQLNTIDYHEFVSGTTRLKLPQGPMQGIPLRVPPVPEQNRIVAAIEEHLSRLDAAVAGLERVKALLPRYRAAVLKAAFDSPVTGGNSGMAWPRVRLGDVAQTGSGGTPSRANAGFYGGSVPWVKSGELRDGLINGAEESISEAGLANSSAKVFPPGTVCIALYGATVGRVGILDLFAATNQAVCGILPTPHLNKHYLFHYLVSIRSDLVALGKGGAQPNISQGIVRDIELPVPSLEVQGAVVGEIERLLTVADGAEQCVETVLSHAGALRRSILARAFRGELVPQDPTDEPAESLLERIRAERAGAVPLGKPPRAKKVAKHR